MTGRPDTGRGPGEPFDGETEIDDDEEPEGEIDEGESAPGEGDEGGDGPLDDVQETRPPRDVGGDVGGKPRDTIKLLRQRAQEAERQRDSERQEFQRRLNDLETSTRQRQPDPAQQAREEAEERARTELMTSAEVARYYAEKSERRIAQALQANNFQTQDRIDRQAFEAQVASNPLIARVAPRVEQVLAAERAQGRNTDRLIVAKYLLGDEVLNRHQQNAGRQRTAARSRVTRQTATATNGAGDAQRSAGRQGDDSYEAAMRRLRGVPL